MSGRYIKKLPPKHEHSFPTVPSALGRQLEHPGVGSIWECDCGQRFVYTGFVDGVWEPIQ